MGANTAQAAQRRAILSMLTELPSILAYCPQQHNKYRIMKSNSVSSGKSTFLGVTKGFCSM